MKALSDLSLDNKTASKSLALNSSKILTSMTATDAEIDLLAGCPGIVNNLTNNWNRINAALGSVIVAETIPMINHTGNIGALTDGRMYFIAIWLEKAYTVTGVKFYTTTQGVYTADNNNKVSLYTYSAGTMTRRADSTTNGNLWKTAANAWTTQAFASTYAASPGLHFIGWLYNSSAQTTAPVLGGTQLNSNAGNLDYTNSGKFSGYINAQTDTPSSQAHSGLTINSQVPYFGLY